MYELIRIKVWFIYFMRLYGSDRKHKWNQLNCLKLPKSKMISNGVLNIPPVCVRACVRACMRACVRVCVCVCMFI